MANGLVTAHIPCSEKRMPEDQRGFSLLELSIVVAVILIIVAISVPNLLRSRMLAKEASVIADLDTLNHELGAYWMTCGSYPSSLAELESNAGGCAAFSNAADSTDGTAGLEIKSGYKFIYSLGEADNDGAYHGYTLKANPTSSGVTGQRYFFTDQSGIMRDHYMSEASAADPFINL